jgi:hypothetical protein
MVKRDSTKDSSRRIGSGHCVVALAAGGKRRIPFDSPKQLLAAFVRLFPKLMSQPPPDPNIAGPYLRFVKRGSSPKSSDAHAEIGKFSNDLEAAFDEVRRLTQTYDLDEALVTRLFDLEKDFLERGKATIRGRNGS